MLLYWVDMIHMDFIPVNASLIKVEKLQKHSKCKYIHAFLWPASLHEGKTSRANGMRMVSVFRWFYLIAWATISIYADHQSNTRIRIPFWDSCYWACHVKRYSALLLICPLEVKSLRKISQEVCKISDSAVKLTYQTQKYKVYVLRSLTLSFICLHFPRYKATV